MSDFDKEAERKRLREKYEREEEKRAVTERMSELLLKGATMTNAHCQDCGDPIFRYDGQEFCATCQKTVSRETTDEDTEEKSVEDSHGDEIEVATPDDTRVQFGNQDAPATETDPGSAAQEGEGGDSDGVADADTPERSNQPVSDRPEEGIQHTSTDRQTQQSKPSANYGDLTEANDSLTRSVTDLARRAETTEDLDRKRDLLVATREAAEALVAVRNAKHQGS